MRPGEIYIIDFDPAVGSEIQKRRPALVISDARLNQKTKEPVVLPITSKGDAIRRAGLAVELADVSTSTYGAVLCCFPKALDFKARNAEFVESIPNDILDEILLKTVSLLFPSLTRRER